MTCLRLFSVLGFLLFLSAPVHGEGPVEIDESRMRIDIGAAAVLKLPVTNSTGTTLNSTLRVEFIDTNDNRLLDLTPQVAVKPGSTVLDIPLPKFLDLNAAHEPNYGWLRLKYTLRGVTGIVSVSHVAREPFVLNVFHPAYYAGTLRYGVQVLAVDPSNGTPVANVQLTGRLSTHKDQGRAIVRTGRTDPSGYAYLEFEWNSGKSTANLDLEITGRIGSFVRHVRDSSSQGWPFEVITTTDKPLYQPGEKLRFRVLAIERTRKVISNVPLTVVIHDPDRDDAKKISLVTSDFGEAHGEWSIPTNAHSGPYSLEVTIDDEVRGYASVWIGRYDLPTFTVEVHHDRAYYLPGQRAEVDVQADYLFGKAVPGAKVRIIRESSRTWDYREDKWKVEQDGAPVEGTTDSAGRSHASLNLAEAFDEMSDSRSRSFRDLDWTAFVTDPLTGRTEQRRFAIRITHNPIHIYLLSEPQAAGMPVQFFVTASYADGAPAACDIELFEVRNDFRIPLTSVRTNRYGVARVKLEGSLVKTETWGNIELRARDDHGRTGLMVDHLWPVDHELLGIFTNKVIYDGNEGIDVRVESPRRSGIVILSVAREGNVLFGEALRLVDGRAAVRIPYTKAFSGALAVFAYDPIDDDLWAQTPVFYPRRDDFSIEAAVEKSVYAPGEEAALSFRVRNGDGSPLAAVVGVTVFDKAVEERARADGRVGFSGPCCSPFFDRSSEVGGLTLAELDRIDRSQPIASDLQLASEALLRRVVFWGSMRRADSFPSSSSAFHYRMVSRFKNLRETGGRSPSGVALPIGEEALHAMILQFDPEFDKERDPWEMPYRFKSSVVGNRNQIEIFSSGPDKRFETPDDFAVTSLDWEFFAEYAEKIEKALDRYHERTGGYIRDAETLKAELRFAGEDFEAWRTPRDGKGYSLDFHVDSTQFSVTVRSGNGIIWTGGSDYAADLEFRATEAVEAFRNQEKRMPEKEAEFHAAFARAGIADRDLSDPWGHAYYRVIKTESGYVDRVTITSAASEKINIVPASREFRVLRLRSAGPDGIEGTLDDFTAVTVSEAIADQAATDPAPRPVDVPPVGGGLASITGRATDPDGGVLPGVSVRLMSSSDVSIRTVTDDSGRFSFQVRPGVYRLRIELAGFTTKTLRLSARAGMFTQVVTALELGAVTMNMAVSVKRSQLIKEATAPSLATPRLREYFPETLLWQPALETGRDGVARIKVKLADSITTWTVAAIASTKDGRLAVTEKEITAFQPFFVEHDPPKFLTEGDRIALPVVARNYLDHDQAVELAIKPEDWFTLLDAPSKTVDLPAGESRRAEFRFEAGKSVKDGPQQITARGSERSDAIKKSTTVNPFGREVTQTTGGLFRTSTVQTIDVPPNALPGSVHGEVKIYPNLSAHVIEAIEGIMKRPYGCAEQAISSGYPSLLFLRYQKQTGAKSTPLSEKARGYLRTAVNLLRGYRTESGGFSYWTRGDADVAVTAYAIQFLSEARAFVSVDEEAVEKAQKWLVEKHLPDGSWDDSPSVTAYVVRVLAGIPRRGRDPIPQALAYLQKHVIEPPAPYATASLALAALSIGNRELVRTSVATLKAQARTEGDTVYWDLQTNTPFYGWGLPGRLETTAIVVKTLAAAGAEPELVDKGLLFLLKNKDGFGVWYSSQATVRVLESLVELVQGRQGKGTGRIWVYVNGSPVTAFDDGLDGDNPVTVDISKFLTTGSNRVEVQRWGKKTRSIAAYVAAIDGSVSAENSAGKNTSFAAVHVIENHYVPWDAPNVNESSEPSPLRLSVRFDKLKAAVGETVHVHVDAERVGFRGYGMMLAEIGLPPGADVDRASLQLAAEKSGWDLSSYDVFPDRVVLYLWPKAGGMSFEFQFRPRYDIDARTPASTLYDYYNPVANVTVAPSRFVVGSGWPDQ